MVRSCNHKVLALYYMLLGIGSLVLGSILSIAIRLELSTSSPSLIGSPAYYNLGITVHGLVMIFFVLMPSIFSGLGNYFIPILLGTPEIVFPRLNNASLVLSYIALFLLLLSLLAEAAYGAGWTLYPPLSTYPIGSTLIIVLSLLLSGIGTLLTCANFTLTSLGMLYLVDLLVPACIITSIMLLLSLPVLTAGLLLLVLDCTIGSGFYSAPLGGDPILYQHLFWFFGHPEVYIIILPAFGAVSQLLSSTTYSLVFGSQSMLLAMCSIAIVGFFVWSHHMYTVGLEVETNLYFTIATLLIAIPTGTKVYNWLSLYAGSTYSLPSIASSLPLLFIIIFVFGGATGVILGDNVLDLALHDTYYVVAHFHYILSIAAVLGLLAALVLYFYLYSTLPTALVLALLTSWNSTFFPQYYLGFNTMPRRVAEYTDALQGWNIVSTVGAICTTLLLLSIPMY